MINLNKTIILTSAALAFAVNANESELHEQKVTTKVPIKAGCSSYNKMLESGEQSDMSNIIMLAMMKKCKNQKPQNEDDIASSHFDSGTNIYDESADDKSSNHSQESEMNHGGAMKNNSKQVEETVDDYDHHNQ